MAMLERLRQRINRRLRWCWPVMVGMALVGGCATPSTRVPNAPIGTDAYVEGARALAQGQDEIAISQFRRAIEQNPELRMAHQKLGQMMLDKREYDQASTHFGALSRLDPYTFDNHYYYGLTLQLLNRLKDSAAAYLSALNLRPDDFKANMNLGLVYYSLDELDQAMIHLDRATQIEPDNTMAWSNLGVVLDKKGSLVLAEASYRKAIELGDDNTGAMQNLAGNLRRQRKFDEAVTVASNLARIRNDAASFVLLGDTAADARDWDRASASYDKAFAIDPRSTAALNAKGRMLINAFDVGLRLDESLREAALAAWKQSLAIDPTQKEPAGLIQTWETVTLLGQ